jgi:hypothetical protein
MDRRFHAQSQGLAVDVFLQQALAHHQAEIARLRRQGSSAAFL